MTARDALQAMQALQAKVVACQESTFELLRSCEKHRLDHMGGYVNADDLANARDDLFSAAAALRAAVVYTARRLPEEDTTAPRLTHDEIMRLHLAWVDTVREGGTDEEVAVAWQEFSQAVRDLETDRNESRKGR